MLQRCWMLFWYLKWGKAFIRYWSIYAAFNTASGISDISSWNAIPNHADCQRMWTEPAGKGKAARGWMWCFPNLFGSDRIGEIQAASVVSQRIIALLSSGSQCWGADREMGYKIFALVHYYNQQESLRKVSEFKILFAITDTNRSECRCLKRFLASNL